MPSKCNHIGCAKHPNYGVTGSTKRKFCSEHKKDGMVNVVKKSCTHHGCTKNPAFGVAGSRPGFCSAHKKDGMVDVMSRRCTYHGCNKQASYGVAGSRPESCSGHKKDGMMDVKNRRCAHHGCTKRPSYGVAGSTKKREFCCKHAEKGMVYFESNIQSSGDGRSGGSGLEYGNPASALARFAANGKRRRACSPSSAHAEASSGNRIGGGGRANRHAPTDLPVAWTSVEPARGEGSPPQAPGNAASVKTETGLFEGRPSGSFQSRRSRRSEGVSGEMNGLQRPRSHDGSCIGPYAPVHQPG